MARVVLKDVDKFGMMKASRVGFTVADIANKYGVSETCVKRAITWAEETRRHKYDAVLTHAERKLRRDAIVDDHLGGMNYNEISKKYNVSWGTIYQAVRASGKIDTKIRDKRRAYIRPNKVLKIVLDLMNGLPVPDIKDRHKVTASYVNYVKQTAEISGFVFDKKYAAKGRRPNVLTN